MTIGKAFQVEPLEATIGAVVMDLKLAQLDDAHMAELADWRCGAAHGLES